VPPGNLATDPAYTAGRAALVDRAMKIGLARGVAAMTAADEASARGDLTGTRDPLREFVGLADLPTEEEAPLLVGAGAPASVKEFDDLASAARDRLRDLRGKEDEFEAIRTAKERAAVAAGLGGGLESDLRACARRRPRGSTSGHRGSARRLGRPGLASSRGDRPERWRERQRPGDRPRRTHAGGRGRAP